jgi:hypothetical protein
MGIPEEDVRGETFIIDTPMKPLSSWTYNYQTARLAGENKGWVGGDAEKVGVVAAAVMRPEDFASITRYGMGTHREAEAVIIGRPRRMAVTTDTAGTEDQLIQLIDTGTSQKPLEDLVQVHARPAAPAIGKPAMPARPADFRMMDVMPRDLRRYALDWGVIAPMRYQAEETARINDVQLRDVAAGLGITLDQYKVLAGDRLGLLMGQSKPVVNRYHDSAIRVLDTGVFTTGFRYAGTMSPEDLWATKMSGHLDTRTNMEYTFFGVDKDAPAEQRPVYGWAWDPIVGVPRNVGFGGVSFVLKQDVMDRSSFLRGDSLLEYPRDYKSFPTPVKSPRWLSTGRFNALEDTTTAGPVHGGYYEIQVMGGLTTDDVDRLIVTKPPTEAFQRPTSPAVIDYAMIVEAADKAGLKVDTWQDILETSKYPGTYFREFATQVDEERRPILINAMKQRLDNTKEDEWKDLASLDTGFITLGTVEKPVYPPPGSDRSRIDEGVRNVIEALRKSGKRDATFEIYTDMASKHLRGLTKNARVNVQVKSATLPLILQTGRFKTNLELAGSKEDDLKAILGGAPFGTYQSERRYGEQTIFGYPLDYPDDRRIVYGYLTDKPGGTRRRYYEHPPYVKPYGDARVILKDSVIDRTTFTYGDSLAHTDFGTPTVLPSPVRRPEYVSARYSAHEGEVLRDAFDLNSLSFIPDAHYEYYEAQIHGGVTTGDIAAVQLETPPAGNVEAALEAAGIPYRVTNEGIVDGSIRWDTGAVGIPGLDAVIQGKNKKYTAEFSWMGNDTLKEIFENAGATGTPSPASAAKALERMEGSRAPTPSFALVAEKGRIVADKDMYARVYATTIGSEGTPDRQLMPVPVWKFDTVIDLGRAEKPGEKRASPMTRYQPGVYTASEVLEAQQGGLAFARLEPDEVDMNATYKLKLIPMNSRLLRGDTRVAFGFDSVNALIRMEDVVNAGEEVPPIVIDDDGISDGRHRYQALKHAGYTHTYAFVKQRTPTKPHREDLLDLGRMEKPVPYPYRLAFRWPGRVEKEEGTEVPPRAVREARTAFDQVFRGTDILHRMPFDLLSFNLVDTRHGNTVVDSYYVPYELGFNRGFRINLDVSPETTDPFKNIAQTIGLYKELAWTTKDMLFGYETIGPQGRLTEEDYLDMYASLKQHRQRVRDYHSLEAALLRGETDYSLHSHWARPYEPTQI